VSRFGWYSMTMNKKNFVSASEIANSSYCGFQLFLRKKYGDSATTKMKFAKGDADHRKFNSRYRTKTLLLPALGLVIMIVLLIVLRGVL